MSSLFRRYWLHGLLAELLAVSSFIAGSDYRQLRDHDVRHKIAIAYGVAAQGIEDDPCDLQKMFCLGQAIGLSPHWYTPRILASQLLFESGQVDLALQEAEIALQLMDDDTYPTLESYQEHDRKHLIEHIEKIKTKIPQTQGTTP